MGGGELTNEQEEQLQPLIVQKRDRDHASAGHRPITFGSNRLLWLHRLAIAHAHGGQPLCIRGLEHRYGSSGRA